MHPSEVADVEEGRLFLVLIPFVFPIVGKFEDIIPRATQTCLERKSLRMS